MPKKFWIGLILVLISYSFYHLLFVETTIAIDFIPRSLRHIIKFFFLAIVYFIGLKHLDYNQRAWMKLVWHFIHISGILLLTLFGLFDWFFIPLSLSIKLTLISINELLIAPTLYVVIGILNKFLLNRTKELNAFLLY